MWSDDEYEIKKERAKLLSFTGVGCLVWGIVLLLIVLIPLLSPFFSFFKDLSNLEDRELAVSESPDGLHTINVIEEANSLRSFEDPIVVISYQDYSIERKITTDGRDVTPSDITINWVNNEEATILLEGEKQSPEAIEFKTPVAKNSEKNPFIVVQKELGYLAFQSEESPNHTKVIELRKMTYSKGMPHPDKEYPIRIYYGSVDANLEDHTEIPISNGYDVDIFDINWVDDHHAFVHLLETTGTSSSREVDNIEIIISQDSPS